MADERGAPGTWHALLLRMAGVVPDDLLSEARTWLAAGESGDVAQALVFAVVAGQFPVTEAEADLLIQELAATGQGLETMPDLMVADEDQFTSDSWSFVPVPVDDAQSVQQAPVMLDLTIDPAGLAALDQIDQAGVDAAARESSVSALWRAWRLPSDGSPWPRARRVFVVTVQPDHDDDELPALTSRLQEALSVAGETDPQVEVCCEHLPVPDYQSSACAHAALLWADEPAVPIQIARVFDSVDPEFGPVFDESHPLISDREEVRRLLEYLESALPVLTTSTTMEDILDPERPRSVPLSFRTDGQWIWTDTIGYYLERYALAPEDDLLAHLRSAPTVPPTVSEVALHRVLSFLQRPDDTEPAWVVPEMGAAESNSVSR